MPSTPRQIKLGLFVRPAGNHIASWRHPDSHADAGANFERYVEMARTAERGLFDMLFAADTQSAWTAEGGEGMQRQHYVAWLEPLALMSALSGHTKNIGLACTQTTTYDEPYSLARRFATLDHVSGGRAAWNVITSGNPTEAQNFGREVHANKVNRYERAREFVKVVKGLWDSWDDDAFIRDRKSGLFFDINKMHVLDHRGPHFKVKGPLNVPRSPQGRPIIIQAGASDEGREMAAETADVVFSAANDIQDARAFYSDLKGRMVKYGRAPDELKVLPGVAFSVAPTEQEAIDKYEELQELIHPDIAIGLASRRIGFDLRPYPHDGPLPPVPPKIEGDRSSRSFMMYEVARRDNLTILQLAKRFAAARGHFFVTGSTKQVADVLEEWFTTGACDGFNMVPPLYPNSLEDFVNLVVPELQRRGLYRTRYEGSTLREHFGLARPASQFAKARTDAAE
jgi:FMN-dependent oxidoreductase (nitrilotriacetate monooxygenase family)